ncbi:MAG: D-aminoacyl-tRNA deacylase [Pseudomonadales bacterium]|jgi:D-tyrosyl-tRNA(Tyr) deacylase|nr:D-aminoacyl-tRNA deacylase [Pseudomonadales bacterium]MDP6471778.1 D-aminoacyl-tRNA deacylase [Pseudomonadales bacterium]MDP6828808.1 D-aminoacyl-tRNA deacylase [Pseudomonadales bacterium]|tara:strand:+ start:2528 stop:2965 length:438 start_codon:yes stop_codon:yes gene_type:complete
MRVLLQRVSGASVGLEGECVAEIERGLLAFVGVFPDDGETQADWLAEKTLGLRIFPDADKPMNRSVQDVGGEILVVSQFTLAGDTSKGKRPGFSTAAPPDQAERLYKYLIARLKAQGGRVQEGRFGAEMQVALVNDGPVTFLLEK